MIGKITLAIALATMILSITPLVQASKLTPRSYEDGYNRGISDALNDLQGSNGHGYDDSCPSDHTDTYCRGYVNGYSNTWNSQSRSGDGSSSTQSQSQSQTTPDINIHIGPQSQAQAQSQAQGLDLINAGLTAAGFNWWTRCMLFTAFHISPGKIFKRSALNTTGSSRISLRQ